MYKYYILRNITKKISAKHLLTKNKVKGTIYNSDKFLIAKYREMIA